MAWKINFTGSAKKELKKLDKKEATRIIHFLEDIAKAEDPRIKGKKLKGNLKEFWRYRVGNYRIICVIEDGEMLVLVVRIGHRKEVYGD